ncbi:BfmA/BtgA family mobilization protein [Winogradskyella wichelsiae]|uniref:BfmA/BtgA family mobilization protein n=1 Tax=Winogradskyella wichelsiae TaxID=2697007 RepID=UPI003EFAD0FB
MKFDYIGYYLLKTFINRRKQAIILLKIMDKGYEKEGFETLKIKSSVASQFREFSKMLSKSQSMTLLLMMDFFNENGISPDEHLGPRMETLENRISILIKKRMNGMIAIMKAIEKSQTKPTVAMMQALFQAAEPPKEKLILEKKYFEEKKDVQFKAKKFIDKYE